MYDKSRALHIGTYYNINEFLYLIPDTKHLFFTTLRYVFLGHNVAIELVLETGRKRRFRENDGRRSDLVNAS